MTYEGREKIFSKDYLTIQDVQVLLGLPYQSTAKIIRQIKFKCDRLGMRGKLHVEDYFEYFNITDRQRYMQQEIKNVREINSNENWKTEKSPYCKFAKKTENDMFWQRLRLLLII